MRLSLDVLILKLGKTLLDAEQKKIPIIPAESTMVNSFDIVLMDEDYTIGKILEFIIYTHFYVSSVLTFCGFKKFHPHDTKSTIRVAFKKANDVHLIHNIVYQASQYSIDILKHVQNALSN